MMEKIFLILFVLCLCGYAALFLIFYIKGLLNKRNNDNSESEV